MKIQDIPPGETCRFQNPGAYVQGIGADGNPQSLADAVAEGLAGAPGHTRTPTVTTVAENGTVSAGKRYIEFILSTDFAGTIGGAAFAGATDECYSLPLLNGADTYPALSYTVSAGSARLTTLA